MSITASESTLSGILRGMNKASQWKRETYRTSPNMDTLYLSRIGKKHFIVKRLYGSVLATYRCGYPEAQRRFAALVVTRRLLDKHGLHTNEHWG